MELGRWSSYRKGGKSDNLSVASAYSKQDLSHETCQNLVKNVLTLQADKNNTEAVRADKS